ncbi:MAG: hypothetical protein AAF802_11795 [Planctomycetota bacterium]
MFLEAGRKLAANDGASSRDLFWETHLGPFDALITSSHTGFFARLGIQVDGLQGDEPGPTVELTLLLDQDRLLIDLSGSDEYIEASIPPQLGSFDFATIFGASDRTTGYWKLNFSGAYSVPRDPGQSWLNREVSYRPCDWLPLAYRDGYDVSTEEHRVSVKTQSGELLIDRQSGQITKLFVASSSSPIEFIAGEFDRRSRAFGKSVKGKRNVFVPQKPVTSVVSYLLNPGLRQLLEAWAYEDAEMKPINRFVDPIERLVDADLLSIFEGLGHAAISELSKNRDTDRSDRFSIPSTNGEINRAVWFVYCYQHPLASLFAEDSWPKRVYRLNSLIALGQTDLINQSINAFAADNENGPLAVGSLAVLMEVAGHPEAGRVAEVAVSKLQPDAFDRDLQVILDLPIGSTLFESLQSFERTLNQLSSNAKTRRDAAREFLL